MAEPPLNALTLARVARWTGGELRGGDAPVAGVSSDTRTLGPGSLFVALRGPRFDGHGFLDQARAAGAAGALVDRFQSLDLPQVRVADTRMALGRLAGVWRQGYKGPLIALTGSNGKTTVKEMLRAILARRGAVLATRGNLNNDLGLPLTLLELRPEHACAVVELGANHAGEIAYLTALARPDVALLTNAGPAHLEGFGDLDGVARAKGEIFQGLGPAGVAVINRDDPYADYWQGLAGGYRVLDFGLDRPARVRGEALAGPGELRLSAAGWQVDLHLPLAGRHNLRNALAAAAAALAVGANPEDLRRGLEDMPGVQGRLQPLTGRGGVRVIDDSYNANPASLAAALETLAGLPGPGWLVLGDMAELGPEGERLHRRAGEQAREAGCRRLYALGRLSAGAAAAFGAGGRHFDSREALGRALLADLAGVRDRPTILIKGSRSMGMERIVQALCEPSAAAVTGD